MPTKIQPQYRSSGWLFTFVRVQIKGSLSLLGCVVSVQSAISGGFRLKRFPISAWDPCPSWDVLCQHSPWTGCGAISDMYCIHRIDQRD